MMVDSNNGSLLTDDIFVGKCYEFRRIYEYLDIRYRRIVCLHYGVRLNMVVGRLNEIVFI